MPNVIPQEIIVKAAIKYHGKVYTGVRHALIRDEILKEVGEFYLTLDMQGFVTDTGRFVDRTEAANIAFNAGQIGPGINSLDSYQIFA
jgi:hypothetical protein